MKKSILFCFACCAMMMSFVSCGQSSDTKKTDWSELELKGKVKKMSVRVYRAYEAFGDLEKDKLWYAKEYYFTENGEISRLLESKGDPHDFPYESKYSYAENKRTIQYYEDGVYRGKEETTYTDWGDVLLVVNYNARGIEDERIEYVYNDLKQEVKRCEYYDGELRQVYKDYTYNDAGLVEKCKRYNKSGKLDKVNRYMYDEKGREIKMEQYGDSGDLIYYSKRTYNDNGYVSLIQEKGSSIKNAYTYDNKGNYVVKKQTLSSYCTIEEREIEYY